MMESAQSRQPQKRFLDHFRRHCNVTAAAEATGVARSTIYKWRRTPAFEKSFRDAESEAWDRLLHAAREEAMPHDVVIEEEGILTDRRGNPVIDLDTGRPRYVVTKRIKKREMNPTLAMFLLKSHDPARYRERFDLTHNGRISIDVEGLVTARVDALMRLGVTPTAEFVGNDANWTLDALDAAVARVDAESELPEPDAPPGD